MGKTGWPLGFYTMLIAARPSVSPVTRFLPHRDPVTGQFVSGPTGEQFDDIEVATFNMNMGVPAADLAGGTGFGGEANTFNNLEVVDYDEFVDRNEELRLLSVHHTLEVFANSTETADGTVGAYVALKADPSRVGFDTLLTGSNTITGNVQGLAAVQDSIDYIGRPLQAVGHAPFSDGASGVGGGGASGHDSYSSLVWPAEFGRFHPRDELFAVGQLKAWNIDDAGIHANVTGQHVYGVLED